MFILVTEESQLIGFHEAWDHVWENSSKATSFQTFEYISISWETFGKTQLENKMYILFHKDESNNQINAIFPFYIDKKRRLRFINDIHSDLCSELIVDQVHPYSIIEDLFQMIGEEWLIKSVFLDNLPDSSALLTYLKVFKQNAFAFSQTEYSYITCKQAENAISKLSHLTAKKRSKLNNLYKKSLDTNLRIYSVENDQYPMSELSYLKQQMIEHRLRSANYLDLKMFTFIEKLFNSNIIEIPILFENETPVSASIFFYNKLKMRSILWIVLFKDKKYNLWNNFHDIIAQAQKEEIVIDFGRGGYDYKIHNFNPVIKNLYRLMYSKSFLGNWYIFLKMNISHLRKTLKLMSK